MNSTVNSQKVFCILNLYRLPIESFLEKSLKRHQSRPMREINYTLYTIRDQIESYTYDFEIRMVEIDSDNSFNNFLGLLVFYTSALKLKSLLIWIEEKLNDYQGRISLIDINKHDPLEIYNETKFSGEIQERVRSPKEFILIFKLKEQNKEDFGSIISFLLLDS